MRVKLRFAKLNVLAFLLPKCKIASTNDLAYKKVDHSISLDPASPTQIINPDPLIDTSVVEILPLETLFNGRCYLIKFKINFVKSSTISE